MAVGLTNWSGNYAYQAVNMHRPTSLDELRSVVSKAPKIRALGTRHCFNDIADSGELISVDGLGQEIEVDSSKRTVRVNAAMRYGDLARALDPKGFALHNMASLPHISVGGAVATATHGSGDTKGNLATAVNALEIVTSEGDLLTVSRCDADFNGMVVGIGALGVVTHLTLDVEPSYHMRQEIFRHLPWDVLYAKFDEVMSSADSVSLFHDFGADVGEVWLKTKVDPDNPPPLRDEVLGALPAPRPIHPVPELETSNLTEQGGVPGLWFNRLPHFRLESVPASGDELQAEYMVARRDIIEALKAVRAMSQSFRQYLMISETRTVTGDDLWLSSSYGQDTVCIHCSFKNDLSAVLGVLPAIEEALAPFNPRPHWGKLFVTTADQIQPRYPKMDDFIKLAARLDPRGAFRNAYLHRHVFGGAN